MVSLKRSATSPRHAMSEQLRASAIRIAMALCVLFAAAGRVAAQQQANVDDVVRGRDLAILICANCHVVANDQPNKPILRQPAPSFASIARRKTLDPGWLKTFLSSTHRGTDSTAGMPNPELLDSHASQIIAYLISLRDVAANFPNWDVGPSCRGAANAGYVAQSGDQLKSCIEREQRTRVQLERTWLTYPLLDQNECVQSIQWFEPTYSELATCLEMRTQVRSVPKLETLQPK